MPPSALNAIRCLRESQHPPWKQQDLARRVGVTQWDISAYERGATVPSIRVAFAIAAALGVSVEDVFFGVQAESLLRLGSQDATEDDTLIHRDDPLTDQ